MKRPVTLLTLILLTIPELSYSQARWEVLWPAKPLESRQDTVTLYLIGDVMMHTAQIPLDHSTFLSDISEPMLKADCAVANMEFTLAGEPYTGYPCFSAPDSYAHTLAQQCGIDVFLTANNHITDKGTSGLLRTLDVYDSLRESLGTVFTGCARDSVEMSANFPLYIRCKGLKLALVNFTYGTNSGLHGPWPAVFLPDSSRVLGAVREARRQDSDFVIALPHWGDEYALRHNSFQQTWAEWLVEAGADVIVGSHPHVVQDTTHIKGVPVIYSVGNAVSNMSAPNTRLELAVTLRFVCNGPGKDPAPHMLEPELEFLWCTLPGRLLRDSHATIRVKEWAGRRSDWLIPSDYDNMIATLARVREATGTGN